MKKSNSCLYIINSKNKKDINFESMKKLFHFPSKQIKSNNLLNCFTKYNIIKSNYSPNKSEYSLKIIQKKKELNNISKLSSNNSFIYFNKNINNKDKKNKKVNYSYYSPNKPNIDNMIKKNNIKIFDSDSSYENVSRFGLNTPFSYIELTNNNKEESMNYDNNNNNINQNNNNYNILNNYNNIKNNFFDINNSNIKSKNINKNNNIKKYFINNKNFIKKNHLDKRNYIYDISYTKNKTIDENKKNNTFFINLIDNMKIENKNNFNNNYTKEDNSIVVNYKNNNKILKVNDSINSSENISIDFNFINAPITNNRNIQINNNYNLIKKFISNKNNHFKINLQKSSSYSPIKKNYSKRLIPKSPLNSTSSRTKDISNKSVNETKKNSFNKNKLNKTPQNNNNNKNILFKNIYNINNLKNNKSIDNINNYTKLIEKKEFKEKINPFINIYERELIYKDIKEKKLEEARKKKLEEEIFELQETPRIDELSKIITKNNLPIYKRLNDIENKKKLNTDKIKQLIINEKEITENTINDKYDKNIFDIKKFNKWLFSNDSWDLKKNLKIEKIKNNIKEEKLEYEDYKFKPNINKNNEKIFYNKNIYCKYPVEERLLLIKETKNIKDNKIPSFTPKINKNYKIGNQYYEFMEEDQAEIYNKLKEKIENENKNINI